MRVTCDLYTDGLSQLFSPCFSSSGVHTHPHRHNHGHTGCCLKFTLKVVFIMKDFYLFKRDEKEDNKEEETDSSFVYVLV